MTRDRKILIKDWYDGLYELGEEEINLLNEKNERVDLSALKKEFGIEKFVLDREGVEAIKARTYEPTANIQGMVSGYTGPGHKTIVPNEQLKYIDDNYGNDLETFVYDFYSKYAPEKLNQETINYINENYLSEEARREYQEKQSKELENQLVKKAVCE